MMAALLAVLAAGCGDEGQADAALGGPTEVETATIESEGDQPVPDEPLSEEPVPGEDASEDPVLAEPDDPGSQASPGDDDKDDPRGEGLVGVDDKDEPTLSSGIPSDSEGVPAGGDARLCDLMPTDDVRDILGGDVDVQDTTADSCTYTLVDGAQVTIAIVTRSDRTPDLPFESLVQSQAEALDADGVALPMTDLGDQTLVIEGELGTYLHTLAEDVYLVTFVAGPINALAAAESLTRLAIGG